MRNSLCINRKANFPFTKSSILSREPCRRKQTIRKKIRKKSRYENINGVWSNDKHTLLSNSSNYGTNTPELPTTSWIVYLRRTRSSYSIKLKNFDNLEKEHKVVWIFF